MPGLTRDGSRISPTTWLGIALLVLLVTVDAAIWFTRSDEDAFAASDTGLELKQPTSGDSPEEAPSDKPGSYVISRVTSDGRLVTDHYLVTAEPVTSVQTRIRKTGYPDFSPEVQQLQVFADDDRVSTAPLPTTERLNRLDLEEPSTVVRLHYVIDGAVVASVPSTSGRALALVNPVKVEADVPPSRHVVEVDGQVLGLSCARGRQVAEPCGKSADDGWRVARQNSKSAVLAQVDTLG